MKPLVFQSQKVRSVPAYLEYFFLRFPGALGPEEAVDLELVDTYDRAWTAQGQIWARREGTLVLLNPPSLIPQPEEPSFGLQKPLKVGRAVIRRRAVSFAPPYETVVGEVVKTRSGTCLVLDGPASGPIEGLAAALDADGWLRLAQPSPALLVRDPAPFPGPSSWTKPRTEDPGAGFLLERMKDEWRLTRQYEKGVRRDIDTECLHQYRVHLRRVRSLAAAGSLWERVPEALRLRAVLRDLQQRTNELRDLDVLLLDLPALQTRLPWDEGAHLAGWRAGLSRRRAAEARRVRNWMESEEYRFAVTEVSRLLDDLGSLGDPATAGDLARTAFQKAARALRKSLRAAKGTLQDAPLHEVRIRTKKLRYALEGFSGLGSPGATKTAAAVLKGAQEGLGRFQDRAVLLERLRTEWRSVRSGRGGPDPLAFGLLAGILVSDHAQQRSAALQDCRRLESKALWRALDHLAGEGGGPDEPGN